MKVLFVAVFDPNSTNNCQARGFEQNGWKVIKYDYRLSLQKFGSVPARDQHLIDLCIKEAPNLVLFSKCNIMDSRVIDECNKVAKSAMWYMDDIHNADLELRTKLTKCDYVFYTCESLAEFFKKYNQNSHFLHQCPDEKLNYLIPNAEYSRDVCFIGHIGGGSHRERLMYKKEVKFDHVQGVFGLDHNKMVNECKINLSFAAADQAGVSVRTYKILASAGFLMTSPWHDMENTFKDGKHLVVFNSPEELKEKIEYYLKNPEERDKIRFAGHKEAQKYMPNRWAKNIIDTIFKREQP